MKDLVLITDKIQEVVESMRNLSEREAKEFGMQPGLESPYYFYGDPIDINQQLQDKDAELTTVNKSYPAVMLKLPVVEKREGGSFVYELTMAILDTSKDSGTSPDRMEHTVKPILIPLYNLFLDRLKKGKFFWEGDQKCPPHTRLIRPYHGIESSQGNLSFQFAHRLDAIELVNLKIKSSLKFC